MIDKDDIIDFLKEILTMKKKMEGLYKKISSNLKGSKYQNFFKELNSDEHYHAQLVKDLIEQVKDI